MIMQFLFYNVFWSGRDLKKLRQQEKKKRQKAANSRVENKKDGHKKVRVCRR